MINLKKLDLKFLSEQNGKPCHIHMLNGSPVPGCTSISALFQDDGWKFAWPPKLMYEYMWKNFVMADVVQLSVDDAEILYEARLKEAKGAWRKKRDSAAEKGTDAHAFIEAWIKDKSPLPPFVDPEVANSFNNFLEWETAYKPDWQGTEIQVASEKYRFAGILDSLAIINDKMTLIDLKTSGGIKDEYMIQLAGLCICLEEMGLTVDQRAILWLPKQGAHKFHIIDSDLAKDKLAFLVAREFYEQKNLFEWRCKNDSK